MKNVSNHSPPVELSMSRFQDSYQIGDFKISDSFKNIIGKEKLIKSKTYKERLPYKNNLNKENLVRSKTKVLKNSIKENRSISISVNSSIIKNNDIDKDNKETIQLSRLEFCKPEDLDEFLVTRRSLRNNELSKTNFDFSLNLRNEENLKIIVVDDQGLVRKNIINLIKKVLLSLGINDVELIELSDGIELLNEIIKDKNYQIIYIFTDENMEFLNGSDNVKIIRKMEENKKIQNYPIVSITAFEDTATRQKIINSGVNSIIKKPCNKSDITNLLSKLFEISE